MNKVKLTPEERAYMMEEMVRMIDDLPQDAANEVCAYIMQLLDQQQAERAKAKENE